MAILASSESRIVSPVKNPARAAQIPNPLPRLAPAATSSWADTRPSAAACNTAPEKLPGPPLNMAAAVIMQPIAYRITA